MMAESDSPERSSRRVAVVTGASRGIGLAIAHRLVADGAHVAITGRNADSLQAAAATFPKGRVVPIAGKADDPQHRRDVFDQVNDSFGHLDILVANVGINPVYGPLVGLDLDSARKVLDVNVIGTLAWIQEACRHPGLDFRARSGSIVILSSVTGMVPSPGIGWYGISKAANAHLTRTLAVELGPDIRVNAIAPAVIKTQFSRALYEGQETAITARYPLGRLGEPDDVAASVAFLTSTEASWITGQVLTVDGGLLSAGGVA